MDNRTKFSYGNTAPDDSMVYALRKDLSGGMNTRQHPLNINENQCVNLLNVDIEIPGETSKRRGSTLVANDIGNDTPVCLHNYEIQANPDQLLMYEDTTLWTWSGGVSWASLKADFTTSTVCGITNAKESGEVPDDVAIVQNEVDNAFRVTNTGSLQDLGDTNTSPPITHAMCFDGSRLWCLKNDLLYFSNAYPADYSAAFDRTTNAFRMPVGDEKGLLFTRELGIIGIGKLGIWSLPLTNAVPSPTTTMPQPLIPDIGAVSNQAYCYYGDDIYFFAVDGLRSLKRTVQDKLQMGVSYPISFRLKEQFDSISWAYIDKLSMVSFKNKILISVPTSATTYDTWVYVPATDAFYVIQGWGARCWAKYRPTNEQYLYYGKQGNGVVYRAFNGFTDEGTTTTNGTAITYQEEGRRENLGQPLVKKIGGEVKVKAKTSGNYNIDVFANLDNSGYQNIGTLNINSLSPLVGTAIVGSATLVNPAEKEETFHLDQYGEWNDIQLKLVHDDTNSEDITILERNIFATTEKYERE